MIATETQKEYVERQMQAAYVLNSVVLVTMIYRGEYLQIPDMMVYAQYIQSGAAVVQVS